MFGGLVAKLLAGMVNLGFGGVVDKTFDYLKHKGDLKNDAERIKAEVTVETVRQAVEETRIMADLNKAKFGFAWFWLFAGMFIVPLGLWWTAVIADSIFHFPFDIAHLPNAEMRAWAGDMIRWLFYVGTGVGAAKLVVR